MCVLWRSHLPQPDVARFGHIDQRIETYCGEHGPRAPGDSEEELKRSSCDRGDPSEVVAQQDLAERAHQEPTEEDRRLADARGAWLAWEQ